MSTHKNYGLIIILFIAFNIVSAKEKSKTVSQKNIGGACILEIANAAPVCTEKLMNKSECNEYLHAAAKKLKTKGTMYFVPKILCRDAKFIYECGEGSFYMEKVSPECKKTKLNKYDSMLEKAKKKYEANQYKQALRTLKKAIKISPKNHLAYLYMGLIYFENHDFKNSRRMFIKAYCHCSDKKHVSEKISFITSMHKSDDDKKLYIEGYKKTEEGKYGDSKAIFLKLLKNNKKNYSYYYELGYANIELKEFKDAIKNFRAGLALNPVSKKLYKELNYSLSERGKIKALKKILKKMKSIFGDSPEYLHELAYAYSKKGTYKNTVKLLKKNIKKFPDFAPTYYMLGDTYARKIKDCKNAKIYLKKFIELFDKEKYKMDFGINPDGILKNAKIAIENCKSK
jgi:tetratricopeptide (TPR) repeat protein